MSIARKADRRFLFFASLEVVFWAMIAQASYMVVYLYDQGLSNVEVGVSLALNSIAGFVFVPVFGLLADKLGSKRKTLLILYVGVFVSATLATFFSLTVFLTMSLAFLMMIFRASVAPITDSWLISEVNQPDLSGSRLNYGPIRTFGSIGYAGAGFLFYFLFSRFGLPTKYSFLFSALFAAGSFLLVISYKDRSGVPENMRRAESKPVRLSMKELRPGRLFKNYYFITFLFVYMLLNVPGYFGISYIQNLLRDLGTVPVFVGVIGSVRALCEVPSLLFSKKIIARLGYVKTIFIVLVILVLEQSVYIFCKEVWQVLLFQMVHGLTNGLVLGSAIAYIFSLVPYELSATAQTLSAAACSVISIIGNFLSGLILDVYGVRAIYVICASSALLALLLFALTLFLGRALKVKAYDREQDAVSAGILKKLRGEIQTM